MTQPPPVQVPAITVLLNGNPKQTPPDTSLEELVSRSPGTAAAVNGTVVPNWSHAVLHDGDVIDIVTAVQGG